MDVSFCSSPTWTLALNVVFRWLETPIVLHVRATSKSIVKATKRTVQPHTIFKLFVLDIEFNTFSTNTNAYGQQGFKVQSTIRCEKPTSSVGAQVSTTVVSYYTKRDSGVVWTDYLYRSGENRCQKLPYWYLLAVSWTIFIRVNETHESCPILTPKMLPPPITSKIYAVVCKNWTILQSSPKCVNTIFASTYRALYWWDGDSVYRQKPSYNPNQE